jgi:hypothetical protein
LLRRDEVATLVIDRASVEEEIGMRKLMMLVVGIASCVLIAGAASAGHYDRWTDAERAERADRVAVAPEPAPCPPVAVTREHVSREVYWRTGADEYDDSQANPLRLIAYIIHPVGYTLEWLVTRPFHELVAQPDLEPISGHDSHAYYGESPFGVSGSRGHMTSTSIR